jgi:hypothetical protein
MHPLALFQRRLSSQLASTSYTTVRGLPARLQSGRRWSHVCMASAPAAATPAVGVPGVDLKACHGNFVTPETYDEQLHAKVEGLKAMLAELKPPEPEVFK